MMSSLMHCLMHLMTTRVLELTAVILLLTSVHLLHLGDLLASLRSLPFEEPYEPTTYQDRIGFLGSDEWKPAIKSEFDSLATMSTWSLTYLPEDRKVKS